MFIKILFLKKNRAIDISSSRKILVCDMESCYKYISKNFNVTLIFQNFQKRKENRKNSNSSSKYKIKS